ncbi:hypothetical protein LWI28_008618 [Acer negundo]|uniref:PWWP domain-containing protein n=1 Tax=Acer negundo TaxID=4023 RepID=A0AAD5ITD7_ACENE|nr:hypothetical protein LWI28_008618 [Acer negundo]KAK4846746.1 hypothetical protein QYF36_021562 [Acer negundo]
MDKPSKKTLESKLKNTDVKTAKTYYLTHVVDVVENGVRVSANGEEGTGDNGLAGGVVEVVDSKVAETEIGVKNGGDDECVLVLGTMLDGKNEGASEGIDSDIGVSLLVDLSSEMKRVGAKESRDFGERENGGGASNEEKQEGNIREMSEFRDGDEEDLSDGDEEDLSDGEYEFCVGDFVWGKIKSYPWWPGQVYASSDASDYALKVKQRNRILVAYFDGTFAWCHPSQLKPFEENFVDLSKQSSSKNFVNAVQKALEEIGRLVELKLTCSCLSKESLDGLSRPFAINSGIKQGVLVPDGGIAKLWNYLFGPIECLTKLKHVAQVVSVTNMFELNELKCWLSAFYRAKGGYKLPLYHEAQPIPGLEDNNQHLELDINCDRNTLEYRKQGPLEEEWHSSPLHPTFGQTDQSSLQTCNGIAGNGQYQRRKQKSIAEIMEGDVNAQAKNDEVNVGKERKGSGNPTTSSGRKKKKGNGEANGGSSMSSRPKRRKVAKLLESTVATELEVSSAEDDDSGSEEETVKVCLSSAKKKKGSGIEDDDSGSQEESSVSPVSTEGKKIESDDAEAKDQREKGFFLRERKKSKYLSPPYTSIIKRQSKKDIEAISLKFSYETQLAERTTGAAANLVGSSSPATLECGDEVVQKKDSVDVGARHETNTSSPQTEKLDQNKIINATKVQASTNEVLSGMRSIATDLYALMENNSLDVVREFLSVFRNSVYCNGSYYEMYKKSQPGRKRKTDQKTPEQKSRRTKTKNNEEAKMRKSEEVKSDKPGLKQVAKAQDMKAEDKETDRKAKLYKPDLKQAVNVRVEDQNRKEMETDGKAVPRGGNVKDKETDEKDSPATLFVAFGPGSKLPSRNDLISIYGRFGSLNKDETEMFYTNYCARIVFLRRSEAEVAFNSSQLVSPFGASKVSFDLRSSSSGPQVRKRKQISKAIPSAAKDSGKKTQVKESDGEASPFRYIKQKLEIISSELMNADGKMCSELKSKLEGEVKGIMEKVNAVVRSGSSST